ncbi:MAG: T9SS type A sorting domain-containing protein [Candidatus Latescibacterota bacterium]|nr:MAG: T9SS type A sorting domain-containing protein [Candidatus Latescibacterota bacterium]
MIPKRYLIFGVAVLLLCFGLVSLGGSAWAAGMISTSNVRPDLPKKNMAHVGSNKVFDKLEGGETIATAMPIASLPFMDTGATCDNFNDYDEECPYTGSTSPDVVYSYTPAADVMATIDLCGSGYDTKVYVYDSGMAVVACNDDYYYDDVCGYYVSLIESVLLTGGNTYYIVVDGYGGDCGEYLLNITGAEPCVVSCPAVAMPEGEPPLVDFYIDEHNGGCNSDPPVFQYLDEANICPDTTLICGVSGWYIGEFGNYRDTDWYIVQIGPTGVVHIGLEAEYESYLFELWPQSCPDAAVVQDVLAPPCTPVTMQIMGPPGTYAWFWVGPTTFSGPVNEFTYELSVTGHIATPADDIPPEITVYLNRYCLWPPNHKMVDIYACVTATDEGCCTDPPTWVLTSVTSNEPDNGQGDGNTVDDIQDADIGTPDTHIRLRSERSGQGDGRIYTIVYTATDCVGNQTDATVEVRVPHDQGGAACASMGFAPGGLELDPALRQFALVIRSYDGFDATALDVDMTYVGNTAGAITPERSMEIDNNADGMTDLAVFYPANALSVLMDEGTVGLHYTSAAGVDYLVPNIFALGEPVPLVPTIVIPRTDEDQGDGRFGDTPAVTALHPSYPNPFNPSTTIPFNLVSPERVTLRIYDAQGALVRTLKNEDFPAGLHRVIWDARDDNSQDVATGVYFVRFNAGNVETTRKVVLIR